MSDILKNYVENLRTFENFLDFAIDVSDATAGIFVPWNLVRANQLFTRLTVTSVSIIHLLPDNRYFPSKNNFWDFFSVASLARNLIENYHMFFYVGVEKVKSEEIDFRLKLLNYHQNNEKYKMYSEYNCDQTLLNEFELNLPLAKKELKDHLFFSTLSKSKAKQILSGNKAMYLSNKEISERLPFKTDEFNLLYRFFSNHTHSSPLAYFSISNERGRGEENETEVSYLAMTLESCIKYLSATIIDMITLFPDSIKKLNEKKLNIIKTKFNELIK